jgi:hypothetical protein
MRPKHCNIANDDDMQRIATATSENAPSKNHIDRRQRLEARKAEGQIRCMETAAGALHVQANGERLLARFDLSLRLFIERK